VGPSLNRASDRSTDNVVAAGDETKIEAMRVSGNPVSEKTSCETFRKRCSLAPKQHRPGFFRF
jgi:hypothetical protein